MRVEKEEKRSDNKKRAQLSEGVDKAVKEAIIKISY